MTSLFFYGLENTLSISVLQSRITFARISSTFLQMLEEVDLKSFPQDSLILNPEGPKKIIQIREESVAISAFVE